MVFTAGFLGAIVVCSVQLLGGALVFGRHALGQAIRWCVRASA